MRLLAAVAVLASTLAASPARASATCAPAAGGGDWVSYGHDLSNTRTQPQEHAIDAARAGALEPVWTFSVLAAGEAGGSIQGTPVVTDGCVYVGTELGAVFALNADTGEIVWRTPLSSVPGLPLSGGGIAGSVTVQDGRVYAMVNSDGAPYAIALDQATGEADWVTIVDRYTSTQINASPVIFDGLFFFAEAGPENDRRGHPKFIILDAATGEILKETFFIPDDDWERGFSGAGSWGTAIVDTATRYLYAGTTNPYSKPEEHRYTNAILKIDLDRARPTFGEIVDSFKGEPEQYVRGAGLDQQPVCRTVGPNEPLGPTVTCVQHDIDFGASPNLYVDADGTTIVGCFQKSGVYHALRADTMEEMWSRVVSAPFFGGNSSSTAFHDDTVFVASNPGVLWAIDATTGELRWEAPFGDPFRYQPVTVANGVVYTLDMSGFLHAFDESSGLPLLRRAVAVDTGEPMVQISAGGVAVARNTVYAAANGTRGAAIVAYR